MKRKIVKHGPSTLIISIPSNWAKKYNIKQGDELDVDEQESRLIIDAKKEKKLPEITINISDIRPKLVRRYLINAYQLGYDRINVLYNNPKKYNYVQQKIPELLGYEIIERTNEGCIVQNIAAKIDIDFKSAVKKTFLITDGMINNIYEAYKKFGKKDLANIPYKDVDINKYTSFCLRAINKEIYTGYSSSQIHSVYHIIITVENIADYYKKLSNLLIKFRKDKDVLRVISRIKDYSKQNYEFFYNPNKEKIITSMQTNLSIRKVIKDSFKETKDVKKLLILTLLSRITDTLYHLTSKHLTAINL